MLRIGLFSIQWPDDTCVDISVANAGHIPVLEPLGFLHGAKVRGSIESSPEQRTAYLAFDDDRDGLFEPLRLPEETNYEIVASVPFGLGEALRLREQSGLHYWPFLNPGLAQHLQILSPRLWKEDTGTTRTLVSAFFNPKGYAGVLTGLGTIIGTWLGRNRQRSVCLQFGKDKLDVKGFPQGEQLEVIQSFLKKIEKNNK